MAFAFITEAFGKVKTLLLNVDENYAITTLGLTDATGTAWNPVTNANPVPTQDQRLPVALGTGGGVKVDIVSGAGSGGTALADKAAFTEGTTNHTPVGGVLNETISADPTEDQAAAFRITPKRAQHVNLRDNSGVELGTSGNPVRTNPTGTTTQPVSLASAPLPTGAATEATLAAISAFVDTLEGLTGALTETAPATDTASSGLNGRLQRIAQRLTSLLPGALTAGGGLKVGNVDALPAGSARIGKVTVRNAADAADIDPLAETTFTARIPAALTAGGGIKVGNVDSLPAGANRVGKVTLRNAADSADIDPPAGTQLPAALVGGRLSVNVGVLPMSGTATQTNVASSASSVTLLASNANRVAASFYNDADKDLYISYSGAASLTNFKVKVPTGGYFEMPQPCFVGQVLGIWAAGPTGSARMEEAT